MFKSNLCDFICVIYIIEKIDAIDAYEDKY